MNVFNHFLTSFIVLYMFFIDNNSITEIIGFSFVFGVLLDLNQIIGRYLGRPIHHTRTWVEEPFGLILVGFSLGVLLSLIKKDYFFMVVIPYGIHIILDYLTIHEVSPLSPFSNKNIKTGFFKSTPSKVWYTGTEKGLSESYFLVSNIFLMIILLFPFF